MFLHSWVPHSIIFALGPVKVHWYGLMLALGAIAGYLACRKLFKLYQWDENKLIDLVFWLILGGFIGARLYHVTNEWAYYSAHPSDILRVWNGGLAIHGAVIVGAIITWWFARPWKMNAWLLADILSIGLILGQAIGRWGNYFNQELFGRPTALPWGILIDQAHRPISSVSASFYHPTFLYESLGSLIIFAGLMWLALYRRRHEASTQMKRWVFPGAILCLYLLLYSLVRVGTESLRIDRVPVIAGMRLPMVTSYILIVIAVALYLFLQRKNTHGQKTPN